MLRRRARGAPTFSRADADLQRYMNEVETYGRQEHRYQHRRRYIKSDLEDLCDYLPGSAKAPDLASNQPDVAEVARFKDALKELHPGATLDQRYATAQFQN